MQSQQPLLKVFSMVLIAALLAACAAPAAAPTATTLPPSPTPLPPTPLPAPTEVPPPDPIAVVQAWADAIYSGDADAALSYFTDDGNYLLGYTVYGKANLRWVFDWLAGLETQWKILDCQPQGGSLACDLKVLDGCMAASGSEGLPVKAVFTFGDGKIKEVTGSGEGPEWDAYWAWTGSVGAWEGVSRPEESAKVVEGTKDGAAVRIGICRDYQTAMKTQPAATEVAAGDLVDAISKGDMDAALAVLADDPIFRLGDDKAAGAEEVRAMLDWMAGKGAQLRIAGCEWVGNGIECVLSVSDGCTEAYGAAGGLPGKMTFYSLEDGTVRQVSGFVNVTERKAYGEWLEAEAAWASASRAAELAQAEGYSKAAGEMTVKLCREYAATAPTTQASGTKAGSTAAAPIPIIWDDDGSIDGVTALLYLLRNPAFDVVAATVSPGIAHPAVFAPNLARFLALLGVEDVPVAAGPEQPLAGDNAFPAEWRAASDKFWDLDLPEAAAPVDERPAAKLIVDVIKDSPEPVVVFVSGSLTNLAQALRDDPGIKERIRSVEIMGGAVKSPGNVGTVPAEWNIYIDPVAAEEVFASGVPIRLTPLDATDLVPWMEEDAAAWEATDAPASSVAARFLRRTMNDWGSRMIAIWDLVAAVNVANPELCLWQDLHLTVAQPDASNEGQTVVVDDQAPNVRVCLVPDADAYHDAATKVFAAAP